jgi:tRNA pseudouridine38-40 synthase
MSRNIKLLIAFDGSNYRGWQRQPNGATVQGELEKRLSILCGETISLHGAGRTDAGVHALGMVAHFHTATTFPVVAFFKGLNSRLPHDIRILQAEETHSFFHSRYDTLGKTYRYDFFTGATQSPLSRLYQAHAPGAFDPIRLQTGLESIVGTHDFSSFERVGSRDTGAINGRGAVRTIFRASCFPLLTCSNCWSIRLTGDGFLRQMVRILAGTLIEIGQGKRSVDELRTILTAKDRTQAGPAAPACGLFLEKIYYTPDTIPF